MYMLDTNICIFIIKKRPKTVLEQLRKKRKKGIFISSITLAELEFGVENSEYKRENKIALMQFLVFMGIKNFDENAAKSYGKIKKELKNQSCVIGSMDLLIGAHAKSQNLILVTNNTNEFTRINGLKVEDWV